MNLKLKGISLLFMLVLVVGFSACKTSLLTPTQQDADRMSAQFPGYTLANLTEGKALFEVHCSKCHGLKKPQSRTEAQWKHVVPEMTKMANKKSVVISTENEEAILKYLITMAKATKS